VDPYKYINSFIKFGTKGGYKPGLKRIKALLEPFNHPENQLKIIHIAGSNGKGSTLTFLKYIYQEAGYRVGAYTSPHLLDFNERMEVNGTPISIRELRELCILIEPVVEEIEKGPLGRPSFFEVVTALAFLYFKRQGVDLLLLEVGLGGRLDATNVIESPLASVITSISLEHTSILGDTPEKIAGEKAGIIKNKRPVITAVRNPEALQKIKEIARERDAALISIDEAYEMKLTESSLEGQTFFLTYKENGVKVSHLDRANFADRERMSGEYFISLPGTHQIRNAILAMSTVEILQDKFPVSLEDIKRGLKTAYIPGRLEIYRKSPLIILDGAHNPEGMGIVTDFLIKHLSRNEELWVVLAVLKDKDIKSILQELKALQSFFKLKLVITKNNDLRAQEPEVIHKLAYQEGLDNILIPELEEAISSVLENGQGNYAVCITGSLFTVAGAKLILKKLIGDGINSKSSS
jgi:dihydrofolate synthase/folylpolyglutamate synthase